MLPTEIQEGRTLAKRAGDRYYRGSPHDCGSRVRYTSSGACVACTTKAARLPARDGHAEQMRVRQAKMRAYQSELAAYVRRRSLGLKAEPPVEPSTMFDNAAGDWLATKDRRELIDKKLAELYVLFLGWLGDNARAYPWAIGGRNKFAESLRKRGGYFKSQYHGGGFAWMPAETPGVLDPWGGL